jgi:hypothetical protein
MVLILCHLHDADAVWLCRRLQQANPPVPVLIVSADELLLARTIRHTLDPSEDDDFLIVLQNGQRIEKANLSVVVNRLFFMDPVLWRHTDPKQYQYVTQELNALYLSLLHSVGFDRLYNPPASTSLGGRCLSRAEWQLLGVRTGLPIAPDWPPSDFLPTTNADARILVLNGELIGTVPPGIDPEACRQLTRSCGMKLLELQFLRHTSGYVFDGATVFAALRQYGNPLIKHFITITTHGTYLGNTERDAYTAFAR